MDEPEINRQSNIYDHIEATAKELRGLPNYSSPIVWRDRLAHFGIGGLDLPKNYGGAGLSLSEMIDLFALCGQIDLDLRDVPGAGHGRILLHGSSINDRQRDILSGFASAHEFGAVAITEEVAGSDIRSIKSLATRIEGGYLLTAKKLYVARLEQASCVFVFAKLDRLNPSSLTAFIIPKHVLAGKLTHLETMGLRGVSNGGFSVRELFVPENMRVGNEHEGFKIFYRHFTYWRIAMAAAAIGCARGAVNQAKSYMRTRKAFGGPIGRFTHLQQELSKHNARLQMAWLLTQNAAQRLDQDLPATVEASMAKAESVEIAKEAAEWSMHAHGAIGYTTKLDLEKRLRDLHGLYPADGSPDVLRGQVARELLGEKIYELSLGRKKKVAKYKAVELFPENTWE